MTDLIPDHTIIHARPLDFWPIQEKGRAAMPACFELLYGSGHLRLTCAETQDWVFVTPELIRIAVPGVNMDLFRKGMAVGGALRKALVDLRCAAIADRGILTACGEVRHELQSLAEPRNSRGADQEDDDFDDPVMQPYDRWRYAIEPHGSEPDSGETRMLAIPITHVNRARERNPKLAFNELHHLLADGLSPVMAKIGVPKDSADYAAVRSEWIEIAIESLVANIEEAVKGWPVLPGEPFQNVVLIDGDMFFITLDTIDGEPSLRRRHPSKRWSGSPWRSIGSGTLIWRRASRSSAGPSCPDLILGLAPAVKHVVPDTRRGTSQ